VISSPGRMVVVAWILWVSVEGSNQKWVLGRQSWFRRELSGMLRPCSMFSPEAPSSKSSNDGK